MPDYIDRAALIEDLNHFAPECYSRAVDLIISKQKAIPDISHKFGYWVPIRESEITGFDPSLAGYDPIGDYKCSICHGEAIYDCNDNYVLSDYCPYCGAQMRCK